MTTTATRTKTARPPLPSPVTPRGTDRAKEAPAKYVAVVSFYFQGDNKQVVTAAATKVATSVWRSRSKLLKRKSVLLPTAPNWGDHR